MMVVNNKDEIGIFLNAKDLSKRLSLSGIFVSAYSLKRFANDGSIRAYKPCRTWLFRLEEVSEDLMVKGSNDKLVQQHKALVLDE